MLLCWWQAQRRVMRSALSAGELGLSTQACVAGDQTLPTR